MENKAKYEIDQEVDFVNDYGISFSGYLITKVVECEDGTFEYEVNGSDTPWLNKKEKNLWLPNTYNSNIELNNGVIAKHVRSTDNADFIYFIEKDDLSFEAIRVDEKLHSLGCNVFEEACSELPFEYQAKDMV